MLPTSNDRKPIAVQYMVAACLTNARLRMLPTGQEENVK